MLEINPEKVCHIIVKARQFDAKVAVVEPDPGSNPADGGMREVLEDYGDDPVRDELDAYIASLNVDEIHDLVALAWLGRGTYDTLEAARAEARRNPTETAGAYLLGMPLLGDYLEAGLSELGHSCEDFERGHL